MVGTAPSGGERPVSGNRRIHDLPPFLVGAGLAISGGVAALLLLYVGPGAVPALSALLALLLLSLGAGIGRPLPAGLSRAEGLDRLRRRWIGLFLCTVAGAGFATIWEFTGGMGAGGWVQGVGLALLVVLPFYAGGKVLVGVRWGGSGRSGGGPPLVGAGVGVFVMAQFLFPVLTPAVALLVALVLFSAAALLHSSILDEVFIATPVAMYDGDRGDIRVERWTRGSPRLERTALLEDGVLRLVVGENLHPLHPEEQLVEGGVESWVPDLRSALVLGGGGAGVAWRLARRPGVRVRLVEPNPTFLDAIHEEMGKVESPAPDLLASGWELPLGESTWDLIVIHRGGAAAVPPVRSVARALSPGGVAVYLPLWLPDEDGLLAVLAEEYQEVVSRAHLYRIQHDHPGPEGVPPERWEIWSRSRLQGRSPAVLAVGLGDGDPWPNQIRGFTSFPLAYPPPGAEEGG